MKANKFLKCVTLAVSLFLSLMAGQASAWTFTNKGTITIGIDDQGFFGAAGADLTGLSYMDVITLDPSLYVNQYSDSISHNGFGSLSGTATDTLTINGIAQTFTWDLSKINYGESGLFNALTQGYGSIPDEIRQFQSGYNTSGGFLDNTTDLYSYVNAFNLGLDYNQVWSRNLQPGDIAETRIYSMTVGRNFFLNGTPDFISINDVAAVPEPETYGMMLVGLGLMGFVIRRRKQNQD